MKSFFAFLRTTLTGGILFLIPVVLLIIILGKAYDILDKLAAPLADRLPEIIPGFDGSNLLAIFLVVLFCFVGGVLFRSTAVQRGVRGLEEKVLAYLPGYAMLKSIAADAVGSDVAHDMTTVLVKDDETWNIGFLVEENDKLCTVFIPEAPRHDSGEVKIVPIQWVKKVNVGANKTALSLKRYGKGALAHIGE